MRTLAIVTTGLQRLDLKELLRRESADEYPRVSLFETTLNADIVDEKHLQKITAMRRYFYKFFPAFVVQVIESYRIRKKYDAVISWSERRAFLFALLLKLTRSDTKHVAMMYWMSKPKQAPLLKLAHSHIDRIITWSSAQRDFAINNLKLPQSKIVYIPYGVDQKFWRPMQIEADIICAVGQEMRDYGTLIDAMRGIDIRCHIVASEIRIIGKYFSTLKLMSEFEPLPPNVTASRMNYAELRRLYARSLFVVIPLLPSETSSGLTVLLEAMAMGKAVVCSRIKGHVDVIKEGKTGIFVPEGDPQALREAIQYLWNHPEIAEQMGKEGRKFIEEYHSLDKFVGSIKNVVEEITGKHFEPTLAKPIEETLAQAY